MPLQVQDSDKMKLEVYNSVRAQLRIKNNYKIRREVHSSATAGARQWQNKLEVRNSVRAQLRVKNNYKIRREVHSSATAVQGSEWQNEVRCA